MQKRPPCPKPDMNRFARGEGMLLRCLRLEGGSALPGRLSAKTGISTARVAVILKSLEHKGLIRRENSGGDRRCCMVILTEEGAAFCREQEGKIQREMEALCAYLGKEDAESFLRILRRINARTEGENEC